MVPDELWERIERFLPPRNNTHPRGGGRKPRSDREVFEAILFVLRFKCQWSVLSLTGMCPSSTSHDRFHKWVKAGFFHQLQEEGILTQGPMRHIDWSWLDGGAVPGPEKRQKASDLPDSVEKVDAALF